MNNNGNFVDDAVIAEMLPAGVLVTHASFEVCSNCGLDGWIVLVVNGGPVWLPRAWSQERIAMQILTLLQRGNIIASQFCSLMQQLLPTELAPTEAMIDTWRLAAISARLKFPLTAAWGFGDVPPTTGLFIGANRR